MSNEKSRESSACAKISPGTESAFVEYEAWDLSPVVVPQRSTLYALQPIGMGTPLVESLSSYVIRLAEAHSVFAGMLVQKMIVPLVPEYSPLEQHGLFREGGDRSALINGAGLPALYAVQALETLTLRPNLQFLTFLPLAKTLSMRNLIRLEKAWCPICYEEWRFNGKPIYDPLLWSVREVSSCHLHYHPLSTQCPYPDCAKTMRAIGWRARVGYCSYCWRWLGIPSEQIPKSDFPSEVQDRAWQDWIIQIFSEFLAAIPTAPIIPERQRISHVLTHLVQRVSKGNIAAFARMLGMSSSKVHSWCQGKRTPEIDILLRLCFQMDLSLCEFFFQELKLLHFNVKSSPTLIDPVPRKKRVPQATRIYQALEEVLISNEQPPPTLEMIRQRLGGYHITILKRIHPTACQEIVTRHKRYVQQHKEERLQRIYEEIKQVALQLHTQGKVLTKNRIALHLSQPGVLNDPRVRTFLKTICHELETSNGEKSL